MIYAAAIALLSENPMWEAFGQRALAYTGSGGADFGECLSTVERVGDGGADDWHREWTATADRVAEIAEGSRSAGRDASACEAYMRASSYYRVSYIPLFGAPTDDRVRKAYERTAITFEEAGALLPYHFEVLEIPFENGSLPAYLVCPDDSGEPRPTILQVNGYDSTIQEMYLSHQPAAVRRGYNWLGFDGPGQGRNLIRDGIPIRGDWESVGGPVLDFALERREIDPKRLVLLGWSLGGFLAPRAAAFEDRLAALVADPGQWDQREALVAMLPLSEEDKTAFPDIDPGKLDPMEEWLRGDKAPGMLRWSLLQRGPWVHGVETLFDTLRAMAEFELSPVAGNIACPTLLTQAEGDPIGAGAPKLLEAIASERKQLLRFTAAEGAGGHCEALARTLYHQRVFDWLDETLADMA